MLDRMTIGGTKDGLAGFALRATVAALVAGAGCGGSGGDKDADAGGELAGLYEVKKNTQNLSGCTGGEDLTPPPFIDVKISGGVLDVYICRSTTDCDTLPDPKWTMSEDNVGWIGQTNNGYISQQMGQPQCTVTLEESLLEEVDSETIRLEYRLYQAAGTATTEDACVEQSSSLTASSELCVQLETIRATKYVE